MAFAAASSEHPLATHAVGEVIGQVLEQLGEAPDIAVLFVTAGFAGATEDVAGAVRKLLRPGLLVGATAASVLANQREIEDRAAISLFAASWGRRLRIGPGGARAVRLDAAREGEGWRITGSDELAEAGATLMLLADPFSFPVDDFVDAMHVREPGLTIVGGLASAASGPGGNRLVADDVVVDQGAVGLLLPSGVPATAVVSQGCRPIGAPFVVTAARGNVIEEIAGVAALDRIQETARAADPDDLPLLAGELLLGVVVDEHRDEFGPGDFLIRRVLGGDRERGAVVIDSESAVGTTVQLHVRDAAAAEMDLLAALDEHPGAAALVFNCTTRGSNLFENPHHDAELITAHVSASVTAGMFSAAEIGPVGGRPFVHRNSAAVLVLNE